MVEILKVIGKELGYCNQCDRACEVALIELACWKHVFRICSFCLDKLTREFLALASKGI